MARYDTRRQGFNVPFPMMELAYGPTTARTTPPRPIYHLIDTEAISSGVWTHRNLDNPELYWVFREPGDAVSDYDLKPHVDYAAVCSDFSDEEEIDGGDE